MSAADPRLSIGRRSAASESHLTVRPEPPYVASAPTLAVHVLREQLANAVSSELAVSVSRACELIEEALPVLEKVSRDDQRHMQAAAAIRDLSDMLAGLQPEGGSLRRTSAQRCRTLAEQIAAGVVRSAGDLRSTVVYLLANPPHAEPTDA